MSCSGSTKQNCPRAPAAKYIDRGAPGVRPDRLSHRICNHRFLWSGREGWTLSPAFDINPTPQDLRGRILTTNINVDDGTCDIDLVLEVAEFFSPGARDARAIVREVADATSQWKEVAREHHARPAELRRMTSAFAHEDLTKAQRL